MRFSRASRAAGRGVRLLAVAVATVAAALPAWAYLTSEPSLAARTIVAAMAAAAALFPSAALLACAGLLP